MNFTLFRVVVLLWNSSPAFVRRFLSATGMTRLVNAVWFPYRDLPIPPSEQPVRAIIRGIIQPGWACADVGANYGMMTEVMAERVGATGKVTAFEAHPLNTKILTRRMQAKGFGNTVTIENKAVSDGKQKTLALFPGRRHSPNEWNIMGQDVNGRQTKAEIEIPAVALDEYFANRPLNFLKIDVEGAEISVIAGMHKVLQQHKPVAIVEFHNTTAWESRRPFFAANYRLYTLTGEELPEESPWHTHVLLWPPGSSPSPNLFKQAAAAATAA